MNIDESVARVYHDLQAQNPLVHCITNYVSMDIAANMLNAAGASPAMVHDTHEAEEFASIASGLMINIGTPSPPWVDGMHAAVRAAADREMAWVLRSEEHTSELQSRGHLVCRLLLEKKKKVEN